MTTTELIKTVAPYVTAIAGLLGGIYAASKTNSNQLTATYFSHMVEAYERFWDCFIHFLYEPNDQTRDQFSVAVYNAALYASEASAEGIQDLYRKAVAYTQRKIDMREMDKYAGTLSEQLHREVLTFRGRTNY